MYNTLLNYLTANEILCVKPFGFRKGYSTEHAIMLLTDQINKSF